MAASVFNSNDWSSEPNFFLRPAVNHEEEHIHINGTELVTIHTEPESDPSSLQTLKDTSLAELINSLDHLLKGNHEGDIHLYSEWMNKNIFCVSKFLGVPLFGYEKEIQLLLANMEVNKNEENKSITLLEKGRKKQKDRSSHELRRLQTSINYNGRNKKNRKNGSISISQ